MFVVLGVPHRQPQTIGHAVLIHRQTQVRHRVETVHRIS